MEAGAPFRCRNALTAVEYRQVCWEFKQPPKRSEAEVQTLLGSAIYPTTVGTAMLFENAHCRVWDFFLEPGEGEIWCCMWQSRFCPESGGAAKRRAIS